jgi:hypothetical protein
MVPAQFGKPEGQGVHGHEISQKFCRRKMEMRRQIERAKNGERNREIFAAIEGGESVESIAIRYGLKPASVSEIIRTERHLRKVCPDLVYRALRDEDA